MDKVMIRVLDNLLAEKRMTDGYEDKRWGIGNI